MNEAESRSFFIFRVIMHTNIKGNILIFTDVYQNILIFMVVHI